MGESKLLLALFCNKILTKSEQGVVVVVISWRSGCVTLTVTLQLYRGGECVRCKMGHSVATCKYQDSSSVLPSLSVRGDIVAFSSELNTR